jgi:hypothetical protein
MIPPDLVADSVYYSVQGISKTVEVAVKSIPAAIKVIESIYCPIRPYIHLIYHIKNNVSGIATSYNGIKAQKKVFKAKVIDGFDAIKRDTKKSILLGMKTLDYRCFKALKEDFLKLSYGISTTTASIYALTGVVKTFQGAAFTSLSGCFLKANIGYCVATTIELLENIKFLRVLKRGYKKAIESGDFLKAQAYARHIKKQLYQATGNFVAIAGYAILFSGGNPVIATGITCLGITIAFLGRYIIERKVKKLANFLKEENASTDKSIFSFANELKKVLKKGIKRSKATKASISAHKISKNTEKPPSPMAPATALMSELTKTLEKRRKIVQQGKKDAKGGTRTPMGKTPLPPQGSASTNFATFANRKVSYTPSFTFLQDLNSTLARKGPLLPGYTCSA